MGWLIYACVAVCLLVLCMCYPWWVYRRARKYLSHLPSFTTLPVVGNLHLFMGKGEYFLHQLSIISKMMDVYMSPFVVWLGPIPSVEVSAPEDVKAVTTAYADKSMQYKFTYNVYGDGLISASGSIWKYTSKKLSSAFNSTMVAGYQQIFNDQAASLVDQLKTEVGKEPFNVSKKYINWMALQSIYYATFGVPNTSEHGVTKEYLLAFEEIMKYYCKRGVLVHHYSNFVYGLTSDSRILDKYEKVINEEADKVISQRRREREKAKLNSLKESNKEGNETEKPAFKPYIDTLLDLSESDPLFTQKQIRSELNSIITAGHDTVANALTMSLLMIGSHEDVQNKLYDEMKDIFGNSKRPVTKEDLAQMPYCEAVINETLRLFPSIPLCFRQADKDLELKQCTIPEGTMCGINIWGSGRSKHIWGDNAETFRPERWLEKEEFRPFFIPFSYGKRTCIGKRYSMAMLKTFLTHCVRELVFKADTKRLRLRVYVTLQPFKGNHIQVQLRDLYS